MGHVNLGTAQVIRADSRHLPLADNSVDLVVTSPPYFALRSYQDGGEHYAGQIGDEPTPAEFVAALLEGTRECVRVLKPSGSLWVNLGDKYATGATPGPQSANTTMTGGAHKGVSNVTSRKVQDGVRAKSLIGIPWRYALACIDDLGLILRAEVVWSKPNGLPESVTDRVRRSHEQWFHFTLEPRYFSAVDEIREAYTDLEDARRPRLGKNQQVSPLGGSNLNTPGGNPLGKLPGSVWTIPTEPLRVPDHLGVDHFAAFPTEWPKRIITGWSPAGVCVECGEVRRPVAEVAREPRRSGGGSTARTGLGVTLGKAVGSAKGGSGLADNLEARRTITGYTCACTPHEFREESIWPGLCFDCYPDPYSPSTHGPDGLMLPPTEPAVVLDPFGGTGTTAMVAKALGRHGITVDMSADYCRLAEWRTNDRNQLAKVLGIEKTEEPDVNQLDLFGGEVA
jgi:DNA modification methylase